jgi:hypothetical protein
VIEQRARGHVRSRVHTRWAAVDNRGDTRQLYVTLEPDDGPGYLAAALGPSYAVEVDPEDFEAYEEGEEVELILTVHPSNAATATSVSGYGATWSGIAHADAPPCDHDPVRFDNGDIACTLCYHVLTAPEFLAWLDDSERIARAVGAFPLGPLR